MSQQGSNQMHPEDIQVLGHHTGRLVSQQRRTAGPAHEKAELQAGSKRAQFILDNRDPSTEGQRGSLVPQS